MAKIAGTESTAKIRSAMLMTTSARNSGVAQTTSRPVAGSGWRTKKRWPCSSGVTRMRFERKRSTGFCEMSVSPSLTSSILTPVASRKAPKSSRIQS